MQTIYQVYIMRFTLGVKPDRMHFIRTLRYANPNVNFVKGEQFNLFPIMSNFYYVSVGAMPRILFLVDETVWIGKNKLRGERSEEVSASRTSEK